MLLLALLLAASAPGIGLLLVASLIIGLSATMAPEAHRGKVVGTVMTGLLLGILLSRAVSGFVADHFGWRIMFVAAAISIALILLAIWRGLPNFKPTTQLSYSALLASPTGLWLQHSALRRAAIAQGLISIGFSAFWSMLAMMLHTAPFIWEVRRQVRLV